LSLAQDGGGPLYDVARFGGGAQAGDVFDDSFTPAVLADVRQAIALFGVGQSHLAAHQAEAARRSFERARALDPNLPGLSTSLGLAIGLEGDFAAALAPCRREMEISPDLSLAWRNLGWVQANLGHLDEARAHLRHALELDPNDVGARSMLAQVEAGRKHS